jgi:hypothetical protein
MVPEQLPVTAAHRGDGTGQVAGVGTDEEVHPVDADQFFDIGCRSLRRAGIIVIDQGYGRGTP